MKSKGKGKIELIFLVVSIILFLFLFLWKTSSLIISPPRFRGNITPDVHGLKYENIAFMTEDAVEIKGWYIENKSSKVVIILLHGFAVDKSDLLDVALFLFNNNFSVLLFDFRAHGESGGEYCSLGYFEKLDLRAAVDFLKEKGERKIGVMGFSMGGMVALLEASQNPNISAVISDCSYLSFRSAVRDFARAYYHLPEYPLIPMAVWAAGKRLRINTKDVDLSIYVEKISPRPILIIHGREDKEIRLINGLKIYEKAKEPKELWVVDEAEHLGTYAAMGMEYEKRIIFFFNKHLQY